MNEDEADENLNDENPDNQNRIDRNESNFRHHNSRIRGIYLSFIIQTYKIWFSQLSFYDKLELAFGREEQIC